VVKSIDEKITEREKPQLKGKQTDLEDSLERLEELVGELESSSISLDESLKKFEEGVKLFKICKTILNKVEKKVKVLTDSLKEEDFTENE
jgi:exodeoxyribonuclease VII small subunit